MGDKAENPIAQKPMAETPIAEKLILVVDDSDPEIELLTACLEALKLPIRIDTAHDSVSLLNYLYRRGEFRARAPGEPCLVLLDTRMPIKSGIEALGEIRQDPAFRSLPIVMLTGSSKPRDIAAAYANGVNSYIIKPMGFDQYNQAIELAVRYWTQLNTLHIVPA
jgi:CheY-like chemotaxis protein